MPPDSTPIDSDVLLMAYREGAFPMAEPETGEVYWYSPDPRAVFPLDAVHVPRSVARIVRGGRFRVTADDAFEAVMRACAAPRDGDDGTWIDEKMIRAYVELFDRGFAHSIEARRDGELVGGLYGVHVGGAFFGESMFIDRARGGTDASKVCFVHLVRHLRERGFTLLDTQWTTPHLDRFGCTEVPRDDYLVLLDKAVNLNVQWGTLK